jgi:hypothetical protein
MKRDPWLSFVSILRLWQSSRRFAVAPVIAASIHEMWALDGPLRRFAESKTVSEEFEMSTSVPVGKPGAGADTGE